MDPSVTEQVAKRADLLVVGDRIPDEYLAFRFNQGPARVVFVAHEDVQTLPWIFVAYRYPNGQHDSMTIRPEAVLRVFPAPEQSCEPQRPDPTGLDEVPDEQLREIVHYRTGGLLDLTIACGAESGPFTANPGKVTCPSCRKALP